MKHISGSLCRIKVALACLILSSASAAIAQQQQSLPVIQQVKFKKDTTSIISFGANGDGITLNTQSINKTIASISQKGGGVVLIPSGLWLTGPIELKSNVNLHLKRDTILQFTDDFNTPQFRNFYIKDVVANGAEKAIFLRGLPEMNIKDIHLENVTIKAKKGIEIIEVAGIFLKNINVITEDTSPVVMIRNSSNINISNLKYPDNSKVLFDVSGEKTKAVKISGTDVSKAKMASLLGIEVDKKALEISK